MKKKILVLAFVAMVASGVYFFGQSFAEEKILADEQQLKNLYGKMWQALLAKNIPALEKIHAEDFLLVHMTGMHQPKTEYLRCVRDGELNYFSEQTENIFVETDGNSGKLIGQSKVEAAVFGGRKNIWRLQLAFDVEKIGGEWILKFAQASTY